MGPTKELLGRFGAWAKRCLKMVYLFKEMLIKYILKMILLAFRKKIKFSQPKVFLAASHLFMEVFPVSVQARCFNVVKDSYKCYGVVNFL